MAHKKKQQNTLPPLITELIKFFAGKPLTKEQKAKLAAEKHARIVELEKYVISEIKFNLTQWKEEVDQAITTAAVPVEAESRIFFYVALVGNLVWAATCLLDPPAAIGAVAVKLAEDAGVEGAEAIGAAAAATRQKVINTMSFGGAALGSGSVEQLFPNRDTANLTSEDGKNLVRDQAGKKRAELQDVYMKNRTDWANVLDGVRMWEQVTPDEPYEAYDKVIWGLMFPRVPYDDNRYNVIRNTARGKVEGIVAEFNRQWKKFKTDQMMPTSHQAEALWAMGTLAITTTVFVPKLDFTLD